MSVEKRSLPSSMGNTGVTLPSTMACTAMGMAGVVVEAGVELLCSEGVITNAVEVLACGLGLLDGDGVALGDGEAATCVRVAAAGAGIDGVTLGRLISMSTIATATEKMPPSSDQRARTTYLCRTL
jgi:hypothetical protein